MWSIFFENEAGNTDRVNGERDRNILQEFFWQLLEDVDIDDVAELEKQLSSDFQIVFRSL